MTDHLTKPLDGGWITTISGRKFHFSPVDPEEIFIEDIAHGLAHVCRWGGHVEEFYSVAQHSVIMSKLTDAKFALVALMHDASESYIGDIVRPLKRMIPQYGVMEEQIMLAISVRFGFEWPMPEEVKVLDNAMITQEHNTLRGAQDRRVWDPTETYGYNIPDINPWSPNLAKKQFLKRFRELTEERQQADMFEELERGRQRAMASPLVATIGRPVYICTCGHFAEAHASQRGEGGWVISDCDLCREHGGKCMSYHQAWSNR